MQNPFCSFWWAGYECTDQLNAFGNRVDFLHMTDHLRMLDYDYGLLRPFGIKTVREGIRWSQVEKRPFHYDWHTVALMLKSGQAQGIQQVWDICHFGYPDDLTPLHPMFARRFAAHCRAFVQFYRDHCPDGPLIVTPINEVSFISWLGGEARGTSPYCVGMGWEVKYALMRAYLGFGTFLPWVNEEKDPRWRPLRSLLADVYQRYNRPFVLTETSHPGIDRPYWIRFVADECAAVLETGVPLWGICLYPIIDRPDWDHLTNWHRAGLWDAAPIGRDLSLNEAPGRVLYEPYAEELQNARMLIAAHLPNSSFMPNLPANNAVTLS